MGDNVVAFVPQPEDQVSNTIDDSCNDDDAMIVAIVVVLMVVIVMMIVMMTIITKFQAAAVGLSAIIRALYESSKVAIVRYVFRNKATPKIGFLSPHIKENYEVRAYSPLFLSEIKFSSEKRKITVIYLAGMRISMQS